MTEDTFEDIKEIISLFNGACPYSVIVKALMASNYTEDKAKERVTEAVKVGVLYFGNIMPNGIVRIKKGSKILDGIDIPEKTLKAMYQWRQQHGTSIALVVLL